MAEINKKLVNSTTSIRKEEATWKSLQGSEISYTLADRTATTSKYAHYFASFNIPYEGSNSVFYSGDTIALHHPELFQLNVDRVAIVSISENDYSEYIDGRSITLKVPQWGDTYKTIVSSFYSDKTKTVKIADSPIQYFGSQNVTFLFSDDINVPYTGTTESGTVDRSAVTTWDPTTNFRDRPSAVAYKAEVMASDMNSDQRPWSGVSLAVPVNQSYPLSSNQYDDVVTGYKYDVPVGFACLDKGYIVLTHPNIIDNIPWTSGSTSYVGGYADATAGENVIIGSNAGASSGTSQIVFTSGTSTLTYEDISIRYLTSVVCIGMPGEFFISKNPTWPLAQNLSEINNGTTNFDSIYVTQIGLYNVHEQLIAVAKLDRPIEKTYDGLISFSLEIDI
ncbi:MAG: hypothetical protein WC466_02130 [Candidatus Izemoplasmatales bacterium]